VNFSEEIEAGMHNRVIFFHFSNRSTTARLREIDLTTGTTSPVSVYKGHSSHIVQGSPETTEIEIFITSGQFRVKPKGGPHSIKVGESEDELTFYPIAYHESIKSKEDVIVSHNDEHVCDPTGPCG